MSHSCYGWPGALDWGHSPHTLAGNLTQSEKRVLTQSEKWVLTQDSQAVTFPRLSLVLSGIQRAPFASWSGGPQRIPRYSLDTLTKEVGDASVSLWFFAGSFTWQAQRGIQLSWLQQRQGHTHLSSGWEGKSEVSGSVGEPQAPCQVSS